MTEGQLTKIPESALTYTAAERLTEILTSQPLALHW